MSIVSCGAPATRAISDYGDPGPSGYLGYLGAPYAILLIVGALSSQRPAFASQRLH